MYLSENETVKSYLDSILRQADKQKTNNIILLNSKDEEETISFEILDRVNNATKIKVEIKEHFYFLLVKFKGSYIVYAYKDLVNMPNKEFRTIQENGLLRASASINIYQYFITHFFNSLIDSIIKENTNGNIQILDFYSLYSIRSLFLLFIYNATIVGSWGLNNLEFIKNGILFYVDGNHLKGKLKVILNRGSDLFEITFFDLNDLMIGERKGIYIDELIEFLDRKIELTEV